MSQINFTEAPLGVHSIDHFALVVPDLGEQERFLSHFGLSVAREPDRLLLRTGGEVHVWGLILPGQSKKLAYVCMACCEGELEGLRQQVQSAGGRFEAGHPMGSAEGFWFRDPDGLLFQVKVGAKTQPDAKTAMPDLSIPPNVRGAPARSAAGYNRHWGPGRHVLGSNYFNYVKDSFGQWWEYSAHIDYIEKNAPWTVANFADEDSLYLWGPDMPEEFPVNVEL